MAWKHCMWQRPLSVSWSFESCHVVWACDSWQWNSHINSKFFILFSTNETLWKVFLDPLLSWSSLESSWSNNLVRSLCFVVGLTSKKGSWSASPAPRWGPRVHAWGFWWGRQATVPVASQNFQDQAFCSRAVINWPLFISCSLWFLGVVFGDLYITLLFNQYTKPSRKIGLRSWTSFQKPTKK